MKNFDFRISFVRVLAMLSVILGHWCSFAGIYTYQLGGIGVQIFIFLSGYIYGQKDIPNIMAWGGAMEKAYASVMVYISYSSYCTFFFG